MITEKNSSYLLIGNVTKGSAAKVQDLPKGAVAVVDANTGDILNSAAGTKLIKVVMRTKSGALVESPVFSLSNVKSSSKLEVASLDTQQVSYLGATSVSNVIGIGPIDVGKAYTVNVVMHNLGLINTTPEIKFGVYKALTNDEFEMVTGLKDSFDRQLNNPYPMITVDRVCNGTITSFAGDVDVTHNSTLVTLSTGSVNVNEIVKFKGIAYKVIASSSNSITLDKPYTGITETISSSTSDTGVCSGVTSWGLKFTGVRQYYNAYTDGIEGQLVNFSIFSEDLPVTEYKAVPATPSITDGARIAYKEKYSQFLTRSTAISNLPLTKLQTEADPDKAYKIYTINIEDKILGGITIGAEYVTATNITIAIEDSLSSENIATILEIS